MGVEPDREKKGRLGAATSVVCGGRRPASGVNWKGSRWGIAVSVGRRRIWSRSPRSSLKSGGNSIGSSSVSNVLVSFPIRWRDRFRLVLPQLLPREKLGTVYHIRVQGQPPCRSLARSSPPSQFPPEIHKFWVCQCPSNPPMDGTLSLDDFNASSKALIEKWKEIDVDDSDDSLPDWAWKRCCKMGVPSERDGFLALEGVYRTGAGSQEQIEESNNLDIEHDTWIQGSSDNIHVYDFHIVYSFSYKVPVLYFQGHQAGGQLLTLDEIKEDLPSHSLKVLSESKWTFITREEHPHLSRPWFTLHPCGTSDWMKLLLQENKLADKDQSMQYLSSWLSIVGQAVGLKIPLELYCNS